MRRVALVLLAAAAVAVPLAPAVAARHHGAKKKVHLHFGAPRVTDHFARPVVKRPPPPPPGGSTATPTTPPPTTFPTTRLSVQADEFSLTLSSNPVAAGDALVELANVGEDAHNLRIAPAGGGNALAIFPVTEAGARSKERFELPAGTYEVYCTLLDHRARGMDATLTVR